MMKNSIYILVICAAFLASVYAECSATVTATARGGDGYFEIGGVPHQIYDISVSNTGTEKISSLFAFFGYPSGNSLYSTWNYDGTNGEINLYGGLGAEQDPFNGAGFILAGGATPTVAFVTPICNSTTGPTSGPTVGPTSTPTVGPTSTPTVGPTSGPSTCNVVASLVLAASWTTDGVNYASYQVLIENKGQCPLTAYVTSFALNGGEIYDKWNMESALGGYAITGFGDALNAGDSYGGAGFNVRNAGVTQITPYGSNCQC